MEFEGVLTGGYKINQAVLDNVGNRCTPGVGEEVESFQRGVVRGSRIVKVWNDVSSHNRNKGYIFPTAYTAVLMDLVDGTEEVKSAGRQKVLIRKCGLDVANFPADFPDKICITRRI